MKPPTEQPSSPLAADNGVRYRRDKRVRRGVLIADRIADRIITVGGILVIIAVLGILLFLIRETLPLFQGGEVAATHEYRLDLPARIDQPEPVVQMEHPSRHIIAAGIDPYKTMGYLLEKDGALTVFHARTGKQLYRHRIDIGAVATVSSSMDGNELAFGREDGTMIFGSARFSTVIVPSRELPEHLVPLDTNDSLDGESVYTRIPGDQFRRLSFSIELEPPVVVFPSGRPVTALDYKVTGEAERQSRAFVAVDVDGNATLSRVRSRLNLLTGKQKRSLENIELPPLPSTIELRRILLSEKADMVIMAGHDGRVYRFNTRHGDDVQLAEIAPLLPKNNELTVFGFLVGGQSLLVGGADGTLDIYFLVNRPERGTHDGKALVKARSFPKSASPVIRFAPASRSKSFAALYENGEIRVIHATSQKILTALPPLSGTTPAQVLLSPRVDGVMAADAEGGIRFREFTVPHPETTFRTLFRKVWYEGYPAPGYTWQSSAATDDYEPKLSLIPLIFGSIKAAFYSLLFAIPIAILGAVFTSEFVNARVRSTVKPAMEMMASLPSVVLGFVAALVLAPVVESWIAAVLLAFGIIPVSLILGALGWQLLPHYLSARWHGVPKFTLMAAAVLLGGAVTIKLSPLFEKILFYGDFKAWVNGNTGTAHPFWFLILLPLSFFSIAALFSRYMGRRLSQWTQGRLPVHASVIDIIRWLSTAAAAVLFSYVSARILTALGVDARGTIVDTYVQRNTLVVGFAMGFAVIPIIYTIAEDALNSVPDHLRAASLGCGATQWQTALYVVMPTAASGIFSAIMIGMGRAVGETMIVVMAAGNTPLMDWNIFNGLRALSATIAVELPEAVKDGTLYRVLFLSGLVLFAMTFVINTVAEVVRLRFRKRATQL